MKVLCIMSRGHELYITKGKEYKVIKSNKDNLYQYTILDDNKKPHTVHIDYFTISSYSLWDKIKMFFRKMLKK